MSRILFVLAAILITSGAWGQNPPPKGQTDGPGMGPPSLVAQGFSEAEAKTAEDDLKVWEQSNREWEANLQLVEAQRNLLLVKETLDKAELEKTFRTQYEIFLKRDLARIDLMAKWRLAYGLEKSRFLDGRLRGPQGPGGQSQNPGQQPGPGSGPGPGGKKP